MILGRNAELKQLGTYYDRNKSQIVVLYGQKYIGKTTLIKEFMEDKPGYYYCAFPASEREQKYRFGLWLASLGIRTLKYPEFSEVFKSLGKEHSQKKVIVIDEFQHIIKTCPTFMNELISFIHNAWNNQEYLVILSSSSIGFVENSMVSKIGEAAYELSGFIKLKELSFSNLKDYFSLYSNEDCAYVWSMFGGTPGLWSMFDPKLSVKENIIRKILRKNGPLHDVGMNLVSEELRETGVYNTILLSLSEGKYKLNELYDHTEFSRAKISVYIKNLIELELVKKVFSVDTEGRDYAQKGIYGIANHFVDFTYTFLYKNLSLLDFMSAEEFYKKIIQPGLKQYCQRYFSEICLEYMQRLNDQNKLLIKADSFGTWVGKPGIIDIVCYNEEGNATLGVCNFDKPMFTYEDYEWLIFCADKAQLPTDEIYIFSSTRFDEKVTLEGKISSNLKLVLLDRM